MTRRASRSAPKAMLLLLVLYGAAQNACKRDAAPSNPQARSEISPAARQATTSSARASVRPPRKAPRAQVRPKPTDPASEQTPAGMDPDAVGLTYAARIHLLDDGGNPLPQTDDCPEASSPSFQARMRLLFLAIVKDKPDLALPTFFPLVGYEQVKAAANPEREYRTRLLRAFARDIHEAHAKLGPDAEASEFVGIEVDADAFFVNPGSEGNKLGYFRVSHSKLTYADARGASRSIDIASLNSWRGEWYVMHLSASE